MLNIKKYFNSVDSKSRANEFRRKRFELFLEIFNDIISNQERIDILDVGGWEIFWKNMGIEKYSNIHILFLNLNKQKTTLPNVKSTVGDGCSMPQFRDKQFDIVFSNSVIEHVGDFNRQQQMANEIRRVGKYYFLQTPNYFFPIEPHFMFIGFHWLPVSFRVFLITHFSLGWYEKFDSNSEAEKLVSSTRLLSANELKKMFNNCVIYKEKYIGLVKSFMVTNKKNLVNI